MPFHNQKQRVHPVGIDLGTTYSCLTYLTPEGQPVTLPNTEGELTTPSVVFFDGDEVVVGTEALRNAVTHPDRVVAHAKRFMGDPHKCWVFDGHVYRPEQISSFILRKLLDGAEERLGRIRHAVITVPAQFSDVQRQLTVEAGLNAGLERVDIINEPVATAMCHVLADGMWFAELANDQTVLVFDLGGGTFDLSLVQYNRDEVKVIASGGDLRLGGLDWNARLENFACDEFAKSSLSDPRLDKESMQALAIEVEQVKRSLSVRPKASLLVQHEGRRKSFPIERDRFELLTNDLVQRTEDITKGMLKAHQKGWAHVDSVLVTGGASRMPMIRNMLQRISGTTLNTTLSPDQSISHGAAYYAGILLSGRKLESSSLDPSTSSRLQNFRQQSVTGRKLGILIRDPNSAERRPHYLIPENTPLPCAYRQTFGTVTENQKRVHLHIVESGATLGEEYVELGACLIDNLPEQLPDRSPIEVTIQYDEQGRVRVNAMDLTSGQQARTTILRSQKGDTALPEIEQEQTDEPTPEQVVMDEESISAAFEADLIKIEQQSQHPTKKTQSGKQTRKTAGPPKVVTTISLDEAERPIPLCNRCGNAVDRKGICPECDKPGFNKSSRKPAAQKQTAKKNAAVSPDDPTEPMVGPPGHNKRPRHKPR